jgi:hypothetical protein
VIDVSFEQATIKVENEKEFAELRDAVQRIFSSEKGKFLQLLQSKNVRIRNLDAVLEKGLIERADESLAKSKRTAKSLYEALTVADQGQLREFYLSQLEQVEPALRTKFQKIYRYY